MDSESHRANYTSSDVSSSEISHYFEADGETSTSSPTENEDEFEGLEAAETDVGLINPKSYYDLRALVDREFLRSEGLGLEDEIEDIGQADAKRL